MPGEYGLGKLANALELGCDCLGHIHYFDVPVADDYGKPAIMKNAICLHEEDYGILWKHYEFRNETFEVRRSRRLVISFFTTVGNYDYGFFWYLYQDGTIQLEVKLTGIIQTAAIAPGEALSVGRHGRGKSRRSDPPALLQCPPAHDARRRGQHRHRARVPAAAVGNGQSVRQRVRHHVARFCARARRRFARPTGGQDATGRSPIPNSKEQRRRPDGYKLLAHSAPLMLAQEGCYMTERGGFATKHVWVTRYAPDERYASGDFRTSMPAATACRNMSRRTAKSKTRISWSGTASGQRMSAVPRIFR